MKKENLNWMRALFVLVLIALVIGVYCFGLNGRQIPKNGDENVYLHIARMTAANGDWLPLQSNLDHMRNTKPPLLFWQGLVSSDWGNHWALQNLRLPNVIYLFLTALLITLFTKQLLVSTTPPFGHPSSGGEFLPPALRKENASIKGGEFLYKEDTTRKAWRLGLFAGLFWIAFWSTFKYGRPFLTSAPETFWMFSPVILLLAFKETAFNSRFVIPLAIGLLWGLGLLTKSFSLLIPAGLSLAAIYFLYREGDVKLFLKKDSLKLIGAGLLALLIFSLWFIGDPHPKEIWQEFVIGENLGKFDRASGFASYLHKLLLGGGSVWVYLAAFFSNAGLLILPMVALVVHGIRHRKKLSFEQQSLWLWIIIWIIFFALPSQRSARYLIPVMPAIAILLALHFESFKAWLFKLSHAFAVIVSLVFLFLEVLLLKHLDFMNAHSLLTFLSGCVFIIAISLSVTGIVSTRWTRALLPFTALSIFAGLSCVLAPINQSEFVVQQGSAWLNHTVAVPCNFRATDEMYQLDFPKSKMIGYRVEEAQQLQNLLEHNNFVVWQSNLDAAAPACAHCKILASRVELLSRQTPAQVHDLLRGNIITNLIAREWLIENTKPDLALPAMQSVCR